MRVKEARDVDEKSLLDELLGRSREHPLAYSTPQEAVHELQSRQRAGLRAAVEHYWKENGMKFPDNFPGREHRRDGISGEDIAYLARAMATARFEDIFFSNLSNSLGLNPEAITYTKSILSTKSPGKLSLAKPTFDSGRRNKNGDSIVRRENVADVNIWAGKPLEGVVTVDGRKLVDYHQEIRERVGMDFPGQEHFDFSRTARYFPKGAKEYYFWYLSLFLEHGVLFEDFHGGESGAELDIFNETVFEPALREVHEVFGVKPLIVPLPWWKELAYYPENSDIGMYEDVLKPRLIEEYSKE